MMTSHFLEFGLVVFRFVYDLLFLVLFLRALVLDPPSRELHPLTTLPVLPSAIFLSKILFALLALIFPVVLGTYLTIVLLGIFSTWWEVFCALIEVTINTAMLLAAVGFFALYRKTLAGITLLFCGSVVGLLFGIVFLFSLVPGFLQPFIRADNLMGLSASIVFTCAFSLAGFIRYQYKAFFVPPIVVFASVIPAYIVGAIIHLEAERWKKESTAESEAAFARAQFVYPDNMDNPERVAGVGAQVYLYTHIKPVNLPSPYFVNVKAYTQNFNSKGTLLSGRVINSSPIQEYINRQISPQEELAISSNLLSKLAGLPVSGVNAFSSVEAMFFCCDTSDLGPTDDVAESIKGQFYLSEHSVEMSPETLLIKDGASFVHNRTRYTIQNIQRHDNGEQTFNIVAETVPISMLAPYDISQTHVYVFDDHEGFEVLGDFNPFDNTFSTVAVYQGTYNPSYPHLKLFWVHDLGTLNVPFEFKNVRLREKTMK